MERFHLTRLHLMRMSWGEVIMLFAATYDGDEPKAGIREATQQDYDNWA